MTPAADEGGLSVEELIAAAILCFFAVQGSIPFLAPHQSLAATDLPATRLMFWGGVGSQALVYASIAFLLLRLARELVSRLWAMQWALALAVLAMASTFWSQFPAYTARRSLGFAMAGFFGLYLAVRFSCRQQLRVLRVAMLALAVGTAILALAFPHWGLDASAGHHADWQGVFTQKNACGRMMVVATAVLFADWRTTWRRAASLLLFAGVMVMSGSRSAWMVETALVAVWVLVRVSRRMESKSRVITLASVAALLPVIAAGFYAALPMLLVWMGRSRTLSGRTLIWRQTWIFIHQRPWFGWGYNGFWHGMHGEAFRVIASVRFMVFHAQNGFLETWLELGLAGLALFALSYARAWRRLWPALRRGETNRVLWPVFLLTLILLYDVDEVSLLIYNGVFWVLYVAVLADIEFLAQEQTARNADRYADPRSTYATGAVLPQ